jgi:DNA-3-methyladenine glycosylase I
VTELDGSAVPTEPQRCDWAVGPLMTAYHDHEWGVPTHDEHMLFELLILEGAQAGLSWRTVLERREGYRRAFAGFDPERVAAMDAADQAALLGDSGIIRNRAKIAAAVSNAQAFLAVQAEAGSFDRWLWDWVEGTPVVTRWKRLGDVPASTPLSEALSKDLRRRGFRFVGPTICYAYLQAAGLVDDHLAGCWRGLVAPLA